MESYLDDHFLQESLGELRAKLHLVHADLCGPMQVESLRGNQYFLVFVDDYTRMCWLYPLKNKQEVFQYFQNFVAFVERKSSCKLIINRTDRGGEFISRQFKCFVRNWVLNMN